MAHGAPQKVLMRFSGLVFGISSLSSTRRHASMHPMEAHSALLHRRCRSPQPSFRMSDASESRRSIRSWTDLSQHPFWAIFRAEEVPMYRKRGSVFAEVSMSKHDWLYFGTAHRQAQYCAFCYIFSRNIASCLDHL